MLQPNFTRLAVLFFAGASSCFFTVHRTSGGEWIPVSSEQACDSECEAPRPSCCESLHRKLRLHGAYARRALCPRYVSLPYTQPNSIMYSSPSSAGYGVPPMPAPGFMGGYTNGNGYGAYGYGPAPAYASPGSVFIR